MIVGYARVSTHDQDTDIQLANLKAAGAEKVFSEKLSGTKAANRVQLQACLEFCREGDVLIVTKMDRLARSTEDLLAIIRQLEAKGVGFRCTDQSGVDTTTIHGKLMITILAAVAEFETGIRRERQLEGIAKAKDEGAYKGRKATIDANRIRELRDNGVGPAEIAREMGITRQSVYRLTQ